MMQKNFDITKTTEKGYTRQPNAILIDPELTTDAKVVIFFLLSLTKDFHVTAKSISKTVHISEAKVQSAVKLLQRTGYISIEKVKTCSRFGGYKWFISDVSGYYRNSDFHSSENRNSENRNSENRNSENRNSENSHIYQQHISQKLIVNKENNQKLYSQQPLLQPQAGATEVISQKEYLFQRFLNQYPKAVLAREMDATRSTFYAIPDLEIIFDDIQTGLTAWCASAEWNRDGGRWIKKPLNWLKERQWEKINTAEKSATDKVILEKALSFFGDSEVFI